jgi:uncharacterized protein (DUF1501 family)
MSSTRRGFLVGCSAAIASLASARFTNLLFAAPGSSTVEDTLVVLYLRGGFDGLNLVLPTGGADRALYETARPLIKVPESGTNAALALGSLGPTAFGLHPAAGGLHELYQDGRVAFVHAAGIDVASRSHFDNQEQMELGTPGDSTTNSGWLTRLLSTHPSLPPDLFLPAIATGSAQPRAYQGSDLAITLNSRDDLVLNTGPYDWRSAMKTALRDLLENGTSDLHLDGLSSMDAATFFEESVPPLSSYIPENGAVYPSGTYSNHLKFIAQLIKLDLGLRAVTVDLGGWDTHNGQGTAVAGQYFWKKIVELSAGLSALYADLDGGWQDTNRRTTVVLMSEFGRRFRENADRGTDHGHGNVMMVLSGAVNGGLYGTWNGLENDALFDNADLPITTDYRQVLSEIAGRRFGNPNWAQIFPGYAGYSPLGLFPETLFADGFESSDTSCWSSASG